MVHTHVYIYILYIYIIYNIYIIYIYIYIHRYSTWIFGWGRRLKEDTTNHFTVIFSGIDIMGWHFRGEATELWVYSMGSLRNGPHKWEFLWLGISEMRWIGVKNPG